MRPDALASIDVQVHEQMLAAGHANVGDYTPPGGGASVQVRVYLDLGVKVVGEFGQIVRRRDELQVLAVDGVEFKEKGTVAVENADRTGAVAYVLTDKLDDDGSMSRWAVRRG